MNQKKYHGVIVPMVTPFTEAGEIDLPAVEKITANLAGNGACPFILGTTGEGPSVPQAGREEFVQAVVKCAAGKVHVYACVIGNCVGELVVEANRYLRCGADAVVAPLPFYYPLKPTHMLKFYQSLSDGIDGPLLIYNITITTHMSIPLDVIEQLSRRENVVGLKDSENDLDRARQAIDTWKGREDFSYFMGCGALAGETLLLGGDGIVVGTGNVVPGLYRQMHQAALSGDEDAVRRLQDRAMAISNIYQQNAVLSESLAILKVMMEHMDLCKRWVLPPLSDIDAEREKQTVEKMKSLGMI